MVFLTEITLFKKNVSKWKNLKTLFSRYSMPCQWYCTCNVLFTRLLKCYFSTLFIS